MARPSASLLYRERAAELREAAEASATKTELLLLAERYERLAFELEAWGRDYLAAEAAQAEEQLAGKDTA
jgi:hypothetical protein